MSSPSTDDASTASLEPTQFHSFHLNKAPSVVSWTDDNDQSHTLSGDPHGNEHVAFDGQHDPESNTAMFKIIANIAYKGKRNKSNIFLYISPDRVRNLSIVENDEATPNSLGTSVYTLEFTLSASPALIVPKGDWVPKNETAQATLASFESLSRMTVFRVAFPARTLAKNCLVALCEKASLSECLKATPDALNVAKLYGGQGGKAIEQEQPEAAAQRTANQAQTEESPPSYGDLGACPPPHPSQVRKRRRIYSDDGVGSASQEKMSLEDICKNGFAEMGRRFALIEKSLSKLTSRLDRVEQLVRENHLGGSSGLDDEQPNRALGERIDGVEERVTGVEQKLETGLSDLAHDVENQIYDVRNEFNDQITVRVDDEVGVAQSHLEGFVKDELYNAAYEVEEVIREKLRDALS
ncbi:unnamed protein product [Discula destructiva]